jgi:hypothetical protein
MGNGVKVRRARKDGNRSADYADFADSGKWEGNLAVTGDGYAGAAGQVKLLHASIERMPFAPTHKGGRQVRGIAPRWVSRSTNSTVFRR